MTTLTFDTLKYANRLKSAGVPDRQAEVMAEVQGEAFNKNLTELATKGDIRKLEEVTKRDLKELELRLTAEIAPLKWGVAVTVGGIIALLLKILFPH
ncbi:MAG: DUF1640 domain-containing protein [Magnetococcales bacterium]|nr:DUF1640 domain-containing protein [Magnetococcales bacterium]